MEYSVSGTELIDTYALDLNRLYDDAPAIEAFRGRLHDFTQAAAFTDQIVSLEGDILTYQSESYLPATPEADKSTVVFMLGNPAPESIAIKALFAYENSGKRYHRFWNVLESTGVLKFDAPAAQVTPAEKMRKLFSGEYESPFNICVLPFYSFATPPGGKWGGVAGVKKLFGKGFSAIGAFENERVNQLLNARLKDDDTLLVFQRDAYTTMQVGQEWPTYDYRSMLTQPIETRLQLPGGANIQVKCVLPTRLLHSTQTKNVLSSLALSRC